jgi:putative ABC transport system substrate-binding protein
MSAYVHIASVLTHALNGRFRRKADIGRRWRGMHWSLLTQQRHWLCTAAMVLMPFQPLSKYSFEPIRCCVLSLGADMRRRVFITLISGAAAWPLAARAQKSEQVRRIGVLTGVPANDPEAMLRVNAILDGLRSFGWIEGVNILIDYRWAAADAAQLSVFARELIDLHPDVLIVGPTPSTVAMLKETRTIPIVFVNVADPVRSGFAASLSRPGGNATGFINFEESFGGKWVMLLKEIVPNLTRAAVIFNPRTAPNAGLYFLRSMRAAAALSPIELIEKPVNNVAELVDAINTLAHQKNTGLIVMADLFTSLNKDLIS